MQIDDTLARQVDAWLQPVAGAARASGEEPSGDTLRAVREALAGKPDTQFAEAVPPDFRQVTTLAEQALATGRDLRLAVAWLRAMLRLRGVQALPEGLRLVLGFFEQFQADLYPLPDADDGSQYARANALAELAAVGGLLGDLRQATLVADRIHGDIRVRSVELALGRLSPREDEQAMTQEQVQQYFADSAATVPLRASLQQARAQIRDLGTLIDAQFSADDDVPDLKPLAAMVDLVLGVLPAAAPSSGHADAGETAGTPGAGPVGGAAASPAPAAAALAGQIQSRADVVRAIDMACEYLARAEPTNPAQLLLRRARQLLEHDFLQLIQVLAPGALDEVARLMGVDPANVSPPENG